MNHEIIAIIPARGGSRGIPRKNIRLLAGKPLIAYSIEAALKSGYIDCESVVSVCEAEHSLYWSFKIEDIYLKPIFNARYLKMRRQELPKVYNPNGAVFVSTPEKLRKHNSFYCPKTIPYIMLPERSVDIDNEIDFILAELLMR